MEATREGRVARHQHAVVDELGRQATRGGTQQREEGERQAERWARGGRRLEHPLQAVEQVRRARHVRGRGERVLRASAEQAEGMRLACGAQLELHVVE